MHVHPPSPPTPFASLFCFPAGFAWISRQRRYPGPVTQPPARLPYPSRSPMTPLNPQAGSPGKEGIKSTDTDDIIDSTLAAALARLNVKPPFEKAGAGHYYFTAPQASLSEKQQPTNIYVTNRNGALFLNINQQGPEVTLYQFLEKHGLLPPTPPMPQQLSPGPVTAQDAQDPA